MKRLQFKIFVILVLFCLAFQGLQYVYIRWYKSHVLPEKITADNRAVFSAVVRSQRLYWREKQENAERIARVFRDALNTTDTFPATPPLPADNLRPMAGKPPIHLGFVATDPAALKSIRIVLAQIDTLREAFLRPPLNAVSTFFICRENWLAVTPPRSLFVLEKTPDFTREPLYTAVAEKTGGLSRAVVTRLYFDDIWNCWAVGVVMPVYRGGEFLGVAGQTHDFKQFIHSLGSEPLPSGVRIYVTDADFNLLIHPELSDLLAGKHFATSAPFRFNHVITSPLTRRLLREWRRRPFRETMLESEGNHFLTLVDELPETGWRFVWLADINAQTFSARLITGSLHTFNFVVLAVFLLLVFYVLKKTLLDPLHRINNSLLTYQTSGTGEMVLRPGFLFREIDGIFANIQIIFRQLKKVNRECGSAREYTAALERSAQVLVLMLDREGQPTSLNEYGCRKTGLRPEEIPALSLDDFLPAETAQAVRRELAERRQVSSRESVLLMGSGESIEIEFSVSPLHEEEGRVGAFAMVIADVSQRKRAEMELRKQITFSQQVFQSIPEAIVITDPRLRITFVNKHARELLRKGAGEVVHRDLVSILADHALVKGLDEVIRHVVESGEGVNQINIRNPLLEEESFIDLLVEPLRSEQAPIGAIILLRDVSEWRDLTAQLRSLQGFMQRLVNASPFAIISLDREYHITVWNLTAERIFRLPFSEAFGKKIFSVLPQFEYYRNTVDEVMILQKTHFLGEERIYVERDEAIVTNLTLYPVVGEQNGVVIHVEDISDFKKMESTLLQAQKMESLGLLTSGIIHDFNNILSGILGYASLLEKRIADDPKLKKYVATIISSGERASTMVRRILNFSRKRMTEKESVPLNELIHEAIDFLSLHLKRIPLHIDLATPSPQLTVDKSKISQILINMLLNARDALEKASEPNLSIRTYLTHIAGRENMHDGIYVAIEIADNGCGIRQQDLPRIFDPFFTTKTAGKGTGLGLSNVKAIIRDYQGAIEVKSVEGGGTTFLIYLPLHETEGGESVAETDDTALEAIPGTVLLIDDEEVVRDIGSDMLNMLGIQCVTAASGEEGLARYREMRDEIALVILDIEMPGISGEKVYQQLKADRPDLPILVASGYSKEYLESKVFHGKIEHFIPKPFKIDQISYQVKKLTQVHHVS